MKNVLGKLLVLGLVIGLSAVVLSNGIAYGDTEAGSSSDVVTDESDIDTSSNDSPVEINIEVIPN